MKLEAVDPTAPISIRPATVTKVTEFLIKSVSSLMQSLSYLLFTPPSVTLSVLFTKWEIFRPEGRRSILLQVPVFNLLHSLGIQR